jgi:hypothetical protein
MATVWNRCVPGSHGSNCPGRSACVHRTVVGTKPGEWPVSNNTGHNGQMVERADAVLAFWDGASPGTADTIRKAQAAGLPVTVVRFHRESRVVSGPESGGSPGPSVPPGNDGWIAFCKVSEP